MSMLFPCPPGNLRGLSEMAGKERRLAYVFLYLERIESMSSPTPYPKLWLTKRTFSSRAIKAPRSLTGSWSVTARAFSNRRAGGSSGTG